MLAHDEALFPASGDNAARDDSWQPDPGEGLEDGRAMNELLFAGGDLGHARGWISPAAEFVAAGALEAVEARLTSADEGDVIRVLDYGAGTGLATIEFLKGCRRRGLEERLESAGATLEMHVVDRPNPWFAHGFAVLRSCGWTRFHSLGDDDGGFRPLLEATQGRSMDAVMVANVFHLIPARALGRAAADIVSVVKPRGRLTWCSPDLSPAGPGAVLFHDANRALRKRWVELLTAEPSETAEASRSVSPIASETAASVRETLDDAARQEAQRRAEAHILTAPNTVRGVVAALDAHLDGYVERPTQETLDDELLEALLLPAIQAEYMAEIRERTVRETVIRELMLGDVLPRMEARGARTARGVNVRWSLGSFARAS